MNSIIIHIVNIYLHESLIEVSIKFMVMINHRNVDQRI